MSYDPDFHILAEEGLVVSRTTTAEEAAAWRARMRQLARGRFKIRTGLADRDDTIAWAWRLGRRPGAALIRRGGSGEG